MKGKKKSLPSVVLGENALVTLDQTGGEISEYKKLTDELKKIDMSCFVEMARLRNVSIESVINECCTYEVENFMKKLGKVVARFHISDSELEKVMINCDKLKAGEVILSPIYLDSCRKSVVKNQLKEQFVGCIIDFPFGESVFKSKVADIKNCMNLGVDGITVMMPNTLFEKENRKTFKKQAKCLSRLCGKKSGIAVSASEISGENLKFVARTVEKTKLEYITFVFGTVTREEFDAKMKEINDVGFKKTVKVMANVESAEEVLELFKYGVDMVLTPFADDIGKDLVKRLHLKNIKFA